MYHCDRNVVFFKAHQQTAKKELDHHTKTLNKANENIQQLTRRNQNIETRLGKRVAFTVLGASRQSSGILKFSQVRLNEGSVFDTTTGQFTSPYAGLYGFTASIIESGSGDNNIVCDMRKNGSIYVSMVSQQGKIDHIRATHGWGTATAAATQYLGKGDSVDVWCNSETGTLLYWSSFSGFLINPDP
ncbi:complement C1q-like protein 2 isoform X2 [Mercenaria mercenaria]|uniref:complement C1q-like protein 2 isoform X2 n=1 Tax=Mercenaria mercenaria TaxID=6596 RepID=UPI00234EB93E|nr:complement C1q-like protein 2 isoform X2 [Mercenaria mercenaria]